MKLVYTILTATLLQTTMITLAHAQASQNTYYGCTVKWGAVTGSGSVFGLSCKDKTGAAVSTTNALLTTVLVDAKNRVINLESVSAELNKHGSLEVIAIKL